MDGGPYIKSPSNGKFIEVDAERGDYVLTTDVMGYVAIHTICISVRISKKRI